MGKQPTELPLIVSPMLSALGITALFTTRHGGNSNTPFDSLNLGHDIGDDESAVTANMGKLIETAMLPSAPHQTRQVHGANHLHCSGSGRIHETEADILIASEPGCPVAVRTADCLPLLLADPVNGVIAAVHAGWRGTVQQVAARTVEKMAGLGAAIDSIHASLGPCIGPCCFEIGEDTADQLASCSGDTASAISRNGRITADLAALNAMQLNECGIPDRRIETLGLCTSCHPERFYSYRRDNGKTGRHLAVVAMRTAH